MAKFVGNPVKATDFSTVSDEAVSTKVSGDTASRIRIDAGGKITWGSGSSSGDTNLYRDDANVLKTDDTFKAPSLFVDGIEIDTTGAVSDQVLKFDGTKFIPGTASTVAAIDDLTDVVITTVSDGDVLTYDSGTSQWVNQPATTVAAIDDLTDVVITSVSDGDVLTYDSGTSQWVNQPATGGVGATYTQTIGNGSSTSFVITHNLSTRNVVVGVREASSPYADVAIAWEATTTDTITVYFDSAPSSNSRVITVYASVTGDNVNLAIDDLSDVVVPTPTEGQILSYDGTNWVNIDNFAESTKHIVKNNSGGTLAAGSAVYTYGANGTNILVRAARANAESTSATVLGLLQDSTANNADGYVVTQGLVSGLNTSAATAGDPVWLSPTTAGALNFGIANKPSAPNHLVYLGTVTRAHATQGEIFVHILNGWELEELHNVSISSPSNNDVLRYNSSSSVWENSNSITLSSLTVGDLTVTGTETILDTTNLSVTDSIIYLAAEQFDTDDLDIGIFGAYGDINAGHFHTGLARDASDGKWKLFSGAGEPSTSVINFSGVTYDTLKIGNLEAATVTSGTWNGSAIGVLYGGTGSTSASGARTNLGLVIGTDVQAYDSILSNVVAGTYSGSTSITTVGTIATGTWNGTTIAIANGGTGSTNASDARTALGLSIGTDIQAYSSTLAAVAGGTYSGSTSITTVGTISTGTWNGSQIGSAYLPSASTSSAGIVQLNNTNTSNSTSQAATANALRELQYKFLMEVI